MFKNLGGSRRFFWQNDENKVNPKHNEARVFQQVGITSITPDERRKHMNEFARLSQLSQEEKAA